MKRGWMTVVLAAMSPACAVGVGGGGSPIEYTMVAVNAAGATSAQIAEQVQEAGGDFVLVVGPREGTWFGELASASQLGLSGPAYTDERGLAFLSRLELLGDTSLVLGTGNAQVQLQDALYQVDEERFLDLMLVNIPTGADVPAATRSLLEYIATDVMANAALVLGIIAPSPAEAQAMDELLRAAFSTAAECGGLSHTDQRAYRIFFGPVARVRCTDARQLDGPGSPVVARVSVGLQQ
ncbi:MAG: hypothetical protein ACREKM_01265 [Longimicrobiales bacterium]